MQLYAQFSPPHLFLLGLLATSALILFQTQRRLQRTATHRHVPKPKGASRESATLDAAQREVQLHDYSREVCARVDSKMAALEHLLRAAHEERLRLEAAIAQAHALDLPLQPAEAGNR